MKILFCFVLVLSCVALVPAQERVVEKAEFDKMVAGGYNHKLDWKDEKYRMTITTSTKAVGKPEMDYSSKTIMEFGLSTEARSIRSYAFGGKPGPTSESLRIGNWLYTRSGSDAWTRKEAPSENLAAKEKEESPYQIISSEAEYRYIGEGKLLDRPVQIFIKIDRQKKVGQKTGETSETESKTKYWVDQKGLILKSEFVAETRGKITSQTTVNMEWQLDPSITFAPPVIAP
jgi:hypothetical protein